MSTGVVDIARRCEVSPSTVCRALNGKADINAETRTRILAECRRAGYTKHGGASGLRKGISRVVACLTPDSSNELFVEKLHYLMQSIAEAGYVPRLYRSASERQTSEFLKEIVGSRPGALVLNVQPAPWMAPAIRGSAIATVLYDTDVPGFDCVALDREKGSYEAVRHLLDGGRTRIALLGVGTESERGRGYIRAHEEAGNERADVLDKPYGRNLYEYGYVQTKALLSTRPVDGLYCVNDACAIGAMRALTEGGRRVPADVAVVGFDDIMAAPYSTPPLSTVRQPKERMAQRCVEFLLNRMRDPDTARQYARMETELVVRASS